MYERFLNVKLRVFGSHYWPQGENPKYPSLAQKHYHNFDIDAEVSIEDSNDRPIEFIDFANKLRAILYGGAQLELFKEAEFRPDFIGLTTYVYNHKEVIDFKDKSCGDIAKLVVDIILTNKQLKEEFPALNHIKWVAVEVAEDGGHSETIVYTQD